MGEEDGVKYTHYNLTPAQLQAHCQEKLETVKAQLFRDLVQAAWPNAKVFCIGHDECGAGASRS